MNNLGFMYIIMYIASGSKLNCFSLPDKSDQTLIWDVKTSSLISKRIEDFQKELGRFKMWPNSWHSWLQMPPTPSPSWTMEWYERKARTVKCVTGTLKIFRCPCWYYQKLCGGLMPRYHGQNVWLCPSEHSDSNSFIRLQCMGDLNIAPFISRFGAHNTS